MQHACAEDFRFDVEQGDGFIGFNSNLITALCVFACRHTLLPLPIDEEWHPETPRGGVGSGFLSENGGEW